MPERHQMLGHDGRDHDMWQEIAHLSDAHGRDQFSPMQHGDQRAPSLRKPATWFILFIAHI
jgi:hypothetical protein